MPAVSSSRIAGVVDHLASVVVPARGRGATRPSATRTVAVDTPVAAVTALSDNPCPCRATIRAASAAVSVTPLTPTAAATSPAAAR